MKNKEHTKEEVIAHNKQQYMNWDKERKTASIHQVYFKSDDLFNILPIVIYGNGLDRRNTKSRTRKGEYTVEFERDIEDKLLPAESFYYCGYVGVPKGHSLYGMGYDESYYHYDDEINANLYAHGGLTFAGDRSVVPGYHFFGFDCAHGGDFVRENDKNDTYQKLHFHTHDEVFNYCLDLVEQINDSEKEFIQNKTLSEVKARNKVFTEVIRELRDEKSKETATS